MLSFSDPGALWLAALLFPVVLLYFLRTKYRRRPVGSIYIWSRVTKPGDGGRALRRRPLLLLALQCSAVILAAAAAAGPVLSSRRLVKPGTAFIIDVSASMAIRDELDGEGRARSRVERAAELLRSEIARLEPDAPAAVFACGPEARFLGGRGLGPPGPKEGPAGGWTARGLESAMAALDATQGGFDESRVSRELASWLSLRGESWEACVLSDGGLDLGGRAIAESFEGAFRSILVGGREGGLGVASLRLDKSGQRATFLAWNGSPEPERASLSLERDGKGLSSGEFLLEPGWSSLTLPAPSPGRGAYALSLAGDCPLPPAGRSFLVVGAGRPVRVLLAGRRNPYVEAALAVTGIELRRLRDLEGPLPDGGWDLAIAEGVEIPRGLPIDLLALGEVSAGSPVASGEAASGVIRQLDGSHPLSRFLDWGGAACEAAISYAVGPGAAALAEVGGRPVLAAWEEGGYRRAALGVDLALSDLGFGEALPVLLRNFLSWCVPPTDSQSEWSLVVGRTAQRALPAGFAALGPIDLLVEGPRTSLTARASGLFAWRTPGGAREGYLAANLPSTELDALPRSLYRSQDPPVLAAKSVERRLELRTLLASALLACLVLEWLLWRGLYRPSVESLRRRGRPFPWTRPEAASAAGLRCAGSVLGREPEARRRRAVRLPPALRILCLALLALSLAAPTLPLPTRARKLVILIDVSDSIGAAQAERSREAAIALARGLERRDRVAVAAFAGAAVELAPLSPPGEAARALEALRLKAPAPGETDIEAALEFALALGGRGAEIVLIGDGRPTRGSRAAPVRLARAGSRVYALPMGADAPALLSRGLELPEAAHPGERVEIEWRLLSDRPRRLEFELLVDGEPVTRGSAALEAGRNEIPLVVDAGGGGTRRIEVKARLPGGEVVAAASVGGLLRVSGRPRVLLRSGSGRSPIAVALEVQGIEAEEIGALPESASGYAGASALVLDDLSALDISGAQQAALLEYVAGGGGLLVVGGPSSLGRGEYFATALEEALPVETDSRRRLLFTRARILFVIDHSGSMSEMAGAMTKQMAAMRGVAAALDGLEPQDEVGLLGFDSRSDWILPFTSAEKIPRILDSLSTTEEGGGTDLGQALEEVLRAFQGSGPVKRHAVILTDGLSSAADFEGLADKLKEGGIGLTAIGIGPVVNETLLKDLARWTGGAYYRASLDEVPALIDRETLRITRELVQEGRFRAVASSLSSLAEGFGEAPPLLGYVITKPKSLAATHLIALDETDPERSDPLLCDWRYGLGRVAVFASDSGRSWLSPWSGRSEFNRLWAQILRSVGKSAPDQRLRASAAVEGAGLRVVVEALAPGGGSIHGLRLVGEVKGEGPFALEELAPGRHEARIPLKNSGLVEVELRESGSPATAGAWAWRPASAELAEQGPDLGALKAFSSALIDPASPGLPAAASSWGEFPLALPAIVACLVLLILELAARSVFAGQFSAAAESLISWASRRRAEADALGAGWIHDESPKGEFGR